MRLGLLVSVSDNPEEVIAHVHQFGILGSYVRAVHAKGAFYPTDPRYIGKQVPASRPSKVDWSCLITRLKRLGYDGPITIEAVTAGPGRDYEILSNEAYLQKLITQKV